MNTGWLSYRTATGFALVEQARNRLALLITLIFIPVWTTLAYEAMPVTPVRFYIRPADAWVTMGGNALTQITGALQAQALIVGFMMFVATARSDAFDRRLAQAGYPRWALAMAKVTALVLVATSVAAYATAWMRLFWQPRQPLLFAAALFFGALIYGGLGILLAAVLRSELAGMFLVIMTSLLDLLLQNPIANASAQDTMVSYLPAYGAMQSAVTAVELADVPWGSVLLGTGWALGTVAAGMAAFAVRSRPTRAVPSRGRTPATTRLASAPSRSRAESN